MFGHLSAAVTLGELVQSCGVSWKAVWSHGWRAVWLDAFDCVGMCWPEKKQTKPGGTLLSVLV